MILMPDMEMLTQILCLCLPWDRAATAIPCSKINNTCCSLFVSKQNMTLINICAICAHCRPLLPGHVCSNQAAFAEHCVHNTHHIINEYSLIYFMNCKDSSAQSKIPCCTLSFIMESWHILSPLASGTSSMPISLALYLTPSPLNLPSRYSSVFSGTAKTNKTMSSTVKDQKILKFNPMSWSWHDHNHHPPPLTLLLFFLERDLGCGRGGGRGVRGGGCRWGCDAGIGGGGSAVLHLCRHGVERASLDEWTVGGKADGGSTFRGSEVNWTDESSTPTHTSCYLPGAEKRSGTVRVVREKKEKDRER